MGVRVGRTPRGLLREKRRQFVFGSDITTIHAIASIIVFIGVSVALGGIYGRGPRAPV